MAYVHGGVGDRHLDRPGRLANWQASLCHLEKLGIACNWCGPLLGIADDTVVAHIEQGPELRTLVFVIAQRLEFTQLHLCIGFAAQSVGRLGIPRPIQLQGFASTRGRIAMRMVIHQCGIDGPIDSHIQVAMDASPTVQTACR